MSISADSSAFLVTQCFSFTVSRIFIKQTKNCLQPATTFSISEKYIYDGLGVCSEKTSGCTY